MGVGCACPTSPPRRSRSTRASLAEFKAFLAERGLYVFTINGFPDGPFHGTRVKEEVLSARLAVRRAACLLRTASLICCSSCCPTPTTRRQHQHGAGNFQAVRRHPDALAQIQDNLLQHAAHLARARKDGTDHNARPRTGPMCYPGDERGIGAVSRRENLCPGCGGPLARPNGPTRPPRPRPRFVGISASATMSVTQPSNSRTRPPASGASGAPALASSSCSSRPPCGCEAWIAKPRRSSGASTRASIRTKWSSAAPMVLWCATLTLPPPSLKSSTPMATMARALPCAGIHGQATVFDRPRIFSAEILDLHLGSAISPHLEVETYTFDVLPEELRRVDVATAVARELAWVRARLDV